eukprot:3073156-Amphidinium_carterae.1
MSWVSWWVHFSIARCNYKAWNRLHAMGKQVSSVDSLQACNQSDIPSQEVTKIPNLEQKRE